MKKTLIMIIISIMLSSFVLAEYDPSCPEEVIQALEDSEKDQGKIHIWNFEFADGWSGSGISAETDIVINDRDIHLSCSVDYSEDPTVKNYYIERWSINSKKNECFLKNDCGPEDSYEGQCSLNNGCVTFMHIGDFIEEGEEHLTREILIFNNCPDDLDSFVVELVPGTEPEILVDPSCGVPTFGFNGLDFYNAKFDGCEIGFEENALVTLDMEYSNVPYKIGVFVESEENIVEREFGSDVCENGGEDPNIPEFSVVGVIAMLAIVGIGTAFIIKKRR